MANTPGYFECSLQGMVVDHALPFLLDRLIGLCPNAMERMATTRTLVQQITNTFNLSCQLTQSLGSSTSSADASTAFDLFDRFPMNLFEHHMAFIPKLETDYGGPFRNDDVMLRLCAPFIDEKTRQLIALHYRPWQLSLYLPPEASKSQQRFANFRTVYTTEIQGDVFRHLDHLGYKQVYNVFANSRFSFEYITKGYQFQYHSLRILITKVFTLKEQHKVSTHHLLPGSQRGWWVQVSSPRVGQEAVPRISEELFQLAAYLKGIVELEPQDHVGLSHKIDYKVKH